MNEKFHFKLPEAYIYAYILKKGGYYIEKGHDSRKPLILKISEIPISHIKDGYIHPSEGSMFGISLNKTLSVSEAGLLVEMKDIWPFLNIKGFKKVELGEINHQRPNGKFEFL